MILPISKLVSKRVCDMETGDFGFWENGEVGFFMGEANGSVVITASSEGFHHKEASQIQDVVVVVPKVEFLADPISAKRMQYHELRNGLLVRKDKKIGIMSLWRGGFRHENVFIEVGEALDAWGGEEIGFAEWEAYIEDGDQRVTLWKRSLAKANEASED